MAFLPSTFSFTLILLLLASVISGEISCPSYAQIPTCSCFVLDDQLHIQCSGSDIPALKRSLEVLNGPVKSYSVYDLDGRASILPNGVTDNVTSPFYHLQISHSSLEDLGENSLRGFAKSLESLAVVSSKLRFIPQSTLSSLRRLKVVDFEGNQITELGPYSFHNILLQKLNLKGNLLENVSEVAFWGLEETLMDVDLSENKLKAFPFSALKRLRLLSSLNLAWNELTDLHTLLPPSSEANPRVKKSGAFDLIRHSLKTGALLSPSQSHKEDEEEEEGLDDRMKVPSLSSDTEWPLLKYLNLNSNYIKVLQSGTFTSMRNLLSLSIHLNSIESISPSALAPLGALESLDLSHNKIKALPPSTFQKNSRLLSLDLSNNAFTSVGGGLLTHLGDLRELFLNGNNILQVTSSTFLGSSSISVLYLQGNSLRTLESGALAPLGNLSEIRLSDNFLRGTLPQDLFRENRALASVSLDGNGLEKVPPGTFDSAGRTLRELRLQNNQITTIPSGVLDKLGALEELHLENNRLSAIQGLSILKKIRHVTLSRNGFETLTSDLLPGAEMTSFSLGNNGIRVIQDRAFANQSSLSILFLGHNRIESLGQWAFYGLRSLERLYLQHNNLSSIHPQTFNSQTKALQYLDLSYNALRTIGRAIFSGLVFVEEINLSHNQIGVLEEGSFSHLRSLRIIDLSYNRLSSISYSSTFNPGSLEILKICCNALTEFKLASETNGNNLQGKLVALKELDLTENALTASVLRTLNFGRLEVLQVSGNNLTDVDDDTIDGFPSLNFLSAEKSHITSLPSSLFKSNPSLAVIRLSENFISHIPDPVFAPCSSSLRELSLKHNKLRSFPYKGLSNSSLLELLTLSGNRINTLDLNRILLPRLKQLDLNDNRLGKVSGGGGLFKSMPALQVIDLGENNISRLNEAFLRNISLNQINLGGNSFTSMPLALSEPSPSSTFVLNMSGNPLITLESESVVNHHRNLSVMDLYLIETNLSVLTRAEFEAYPRLHRLVIKRNPLSSLPPSSFSFLTNLNLLDLSENGIEELKGDAFAGLGVLKSLNLSHNAVKSVGVFHIDLGGLQDLDLSFNQLSTLDEDTFAHLGSLVSLRLRGNWLTALPGSLLGPLSRLSVLDLSDNYVEGLPSLFLSHLETRISSLKLEGNPLNCDCDSRVLWEWLGSHPKVFSSSSSKDSSISSDVAPPSPGESSFRNGIGQPFFVCEKPSEFRGRRILELDLDSICSSPAILNVAIQEVQPASAVISWQGRNVSSLQGYMIGYHALNHDDTVRWIRPLPVVSKSGISTNEYTLPDLEADTPYLICVLGLVAAPTHSHDVGNYSTGALSLLSAEDVLRDSPMSKCTKIRTYSPYGLQEVLQARLGIVLGGGVGILAFLVLMTIAICVKVKKRRVQRSHRNGHHHHQNGNGEVEKLNHFHQNQTLSPPNGFEEGPPLPLPLVGGTNGTSFSTSTLPHNYGHHHHHHQMMSHQEASRQALYNQPYGTLTRFRKDGLPSGQIVRSASPPPGHISPPLQTYRHYPLDTANEGRSSNSTFVGGLDILLDNKRL